jgi:multidrug resistance efflux pump
MKRKMSKLVLPIMAIGMLGFAIYHVVEARQTPPKPPPPLEPARSPFGRAVFGAGIVEAETENISIGAALPGVVLEIYVPVEKVGQRVKKGDPLFLVDNRQLNAQLKYYEASQAAAEAQVAKLLAQPRPEEVPPSEAAVHYAEANLNKELDFANRNKRLTSAQAVSTEDYTQRRLAVEAARQQLAQAKAQDALLKAGAWQKDLTIARANVELAKAQADQTRTDLDRALVRAPVDGRVLQVNVRPGEYVGTPPSQALVVLGSVAKLHVRVDIDEHDIPRAYTHFQHGVPAYASPRGDPTMKVPLNFVRVEPYVIPKKSLTGDNTERVDTRVLQVIYQLDRDEPALFVGMQVDVFLDSSDAAQSVQRGVLTRSSDT